MIYIVIYSILLRLAEIGYSRINQKNMINSGEKIQENKINFYLMLFTHTFFYVFILIENYYSKTNLCSSFLIILFILSQILRFWTLYSLGKHWNINIMTPKTFVSTGIYKFIRHPNYLVVILEFILIGLIASAPITTIVFSILNGYVLFIRIKEEETYLFQRDGYREVMGNKKRFIPGIF